MNKINFKFCREKIYFTSFLLHVFSAKIQIILLKDKARYVFCQIIEFTIFARKFNYFSFLKNPF